MAQFLRGKQAGVQRDLSEGLAPELFALDVVARYGVNSQVSALAYDPVQSLLAVGTNESRFGTGQIYIFGGKRVVFVFQPPRLASVRSLQFCADRLLVVDSRNDVTIFSLTNKKIDVSYTPPGVPCALLTDPSLDYAFIGLQNGDILAYDMDRHGLAQLRIPNLWQQFKPKSRHVPVVSLAIHPRDVGTLLIVYSEGAVTYSFKLNKALNFFRYELQRGAPGGYPDPASRNEVRYPKMVQGVWHPTGTFILTALEDESLVIWDPKSARVVQARTLQDVNVNQPGQTAASFGSTPGTYALKAPICRVAWCSKQNPDDTGILIAGGSPTTLPERGLTFFDFGLTPTYQTSSWQILSEHFAKPRRRNTLPSPPSTDIIDFCLIPRESPHFAGAYDPIAVLAILSSGELISLSFPSGFPITPTNQLHPSLSLLHPFVGNFAVSSVERTRWLGMTEKRSIGSPILKGGALATRSLMRFGSRNIIQTAHADGTVRIWDAGHGDEIENEEMLQVDVARALGRTADVRISQMSMSGAAGEFAVGLATGEVAVFRWDRNKRFGHNAAASKHERFGLQDIAERAEPDLKEGLLPLSLFAQKEKMVTALRVSDVGFVAAGFEDGSLTLMDLRGPAVILETSLISSAKTGKRLSVRKPGHDHVHETPRVTFIEFGVMDLDGEEYSSILLFVGTASGRLGTFKLLPQANGAFEAVSAGVANVEDRVVLVHPLNVETGQPAYAAHAAVGFFFYVRCTNVLVVVVTASSVRIFKPSAAKGASKTWGDAFCYSAAVVRKDDRSTALVAVFGDALVRTFTIPHLREVASTRIDEHFDMQRLPETLVTPTGAVFGWTGPSELTVLNAWGSGSDLTTSKDKLWNPDLPVPPRPTISNLQWISGTQHFTASDLDVLVGGPDRPPSKKMMQQAQLEEQRRRATARPGPNSSAALAAETKEGEGYWAYMQRQVQERTERLNIMGDSMDKLEESSSNWADDVNKFVSNQKKKAVMGMIGSKFGF